MMENRPNDKSVGSLITRLLVIFACGAMALSAMACGQKTEPEYYAEAEEALAEENVVQAVILYKEILDKFPDSPDAAKAKNGLIEAYFGNKEFDRCRKLLDEVLESTGGPATDEGFGLFRIKVSSYVHEGFPGPGLVYALDNKEAFESASPDVRTAYLFTLADLHTQVQQIEEAIAIYGEVLARPAETDEEKDLIRVALERMLQIKEAQRDIPGGIAVMEQFVGTHPETDIVPELRVRIGRAYDFLSSQADSPEKERLSAKAEENFLASENHFRDLVETTQSADEKTHGLLRIGQLLHFRKRLDEGRNYYRRIVDEFPLSPSRPEAMSLLAVSYFQDGDYETSGATYSQVIEAYPGTRIAQDAERMLQLIAQARSQAQMEETIDGAGESESTESEATAVEPEADEAMPAESEETESAAGEADVPQ